MNTRLGDRAADGVADSRRREIAAALDRVRARIAAAAVAAGRRPDEITLIAVTKTFPATDVRHLAALGVHDIGENRDQEAAAKHRETRELALRWHFVGRLQRNKCRSVASYADVVHSVDRPELVDALAAAARGVGRRVQVLVQVSLDGAPGRGGVVASGVARLADRAARSDGLALAGVMAVAPLDADPRAAFRSLAAVAADLRTAHPEAGMISAGMSTDLETAVAFGATHVRVGTALLGDRPPRLG